MTDREHLRQRLEEMRADRDRSLTPFLERAEILLNYGEYGALEEADKLLEVAQTLRQSRIANKAPVTRAAAQEAARAVIENHAAVRADNGNIFQAQKVDLRGASFTQIIQDGLKELPPEPTVDIAFVLLAMTKAQAGDLASRQAFLQQPDVLQQNFASLVDHLQASWLDNYGQSPEQWRPRGQRSIADLVEDAVKALNGAQDFPKKLAAKFHDVLSLDRALVRQLRKSGCVVIMDAISLRHPQLLRAFQRSLLDVFPNTSILTLTPDDNVLDLMQNMVYALQVNLQESEFQIRLLDPAEALSCQVDSKLHSVSPWLVNQVRRIYATAARSDGRPSQMNFG